MLEGSLRDLGVPLRVIWLEGPEVQVAVGDAGDPRQEATRWRLAGGALLEQRLLDGTLDQADERIAGEVRHLLVPATRGDFSGIHVRERRRDFGGGITVSWNLPRGTGHQAGCLQSR